MFKHAKISPIISAPLLALLLVSCSGENETDFSPAAIEKQIDDGDYGKARYLTSLAFQSGEVSPQTRILAAQIDLAQIDGIGAESNLRAAMESGIGKQKIYPMLAEALARQNKPEITLKIARESGSKATQYFVTGLLGLHEKQIWQARQDIEKAHKLAPDNHRISIELAYVRAELGLFDPALQLAGRAAKDEPRNIKAHEAVAEIAMRKQDFPKAIQSFDEILNIASGNRSAIAGKARALVASGKLNTAKKHINALPPILIENDDMQMMLGKIAAQQNKFQKAVTHFANAGQMVKADSEAIYWSGITQLNLGQPWKAISLIEEAVRARPDLPEYRAKLIETLLFVGDETGAKIRIAEIPANQSDDKVFDKIIARKAN